MKRPASMELTPDQAETLTAGRWYGPREPVVIYGAEIDSRAVQAGSLFACFDGARVDGHDYAAVAVGAGAVMVLASRLVDVPAPVLVVDDVIAALGALARYQRQCLDHITWIGVTGSNGKTTVKELLLEACAPAGLVHATAGNRNNQIGVPLTILATPSEAAVAVIEMGTSEPGEIATLAAITQHDIGVLTSIGPAHLEGLGGLEGVAHEKSAIFANLAADAPAVFGRHGLNEAAYAAGCDPVGLERIIHAAAPQVQIEVIEPAAIDGEALGDGVVLRAEEHQVTIPLAGPHNLANAALAWRVACLAGVAGSAALQALGQAQAVAGRLCEHTLGEHVLLDDSYNANPASMFAGLAVLARRPGARLAVLGAMGELGADSDALHAQVGAEAARLGVPMITVGDAAQPLANGYRERGGRDCLHAADRLAAVAMVLERCAVGPTTVLVKASRSAGLDAVVHDVIERSEAAAGGVAC